MDLTPPRSLVNYRLGDAATSGTGGTSGNGGVGTGGVVGTGGILGAGGSGVAGASGAGGGSVLPDAAGGASGADGNTTTDTPIGAGGVIGSGGSTDRDGPPGTGGITGTGGTPPPDAPQGTGGSTGGQGGASSDAQPGTGGKTGTGGTTAGTGGVTGTGGKTGTGGVTGTGGAGTGGAGTGGATGYSCASAITPASGYVTNFTDWNATTARWGTGTLIGTIFNYASTSPAATMTTKVEGTTPGLHMVGSTSSTGYAGGGLTFLSCVTTASFTKISFDVYGSAGSCAIQLQLQTFDQRPNNQTPPGGCVLATDGSGCFTFPNKSQVVSLSTAVAAPGTTVSTTLSGLTNWSASEGAQIVAVQWQFTGTCSIDATFTNIKFQ